MKMFSKQKQQQQRFFDSMLKGYRKVIGSLNNEHGELGPTSEQFCF